MKSKFIFQDLLKNCGITINGDKSYDILVYNEKLYDRVSRQGSLALGEAYMDGWWDCKSLDEFFNKIIRTDIEGKIKTNFKMLYFFSWNSLLYYFKSSYINSKKAFEVAEKHYDIGNDLYKIMLDKRLAYTCGYWKGAKNLDEAQEAKLKLICQKIGLKKGQKILDIGSGWGSFIKFAAEKYEADALGITVSKEQKNLADKLNSGFKAETRILDYRDINERFDHIVSVGMFEHVGYKSYRKFMKIAHEALDDNGLFLLHTIGGNKSVKFGDPWIGKYIFPNGMLPSLKQISEAVEGLFVIEDIHNFGADYDKTLMCWYKNFDEGWDKIEKKYDKRFYRMWKYYLLLCAGSFRARKNQLWQIVLSKKGVSGGYKLNR